MALRFWEYSRDGTKKQIELTRDVYCFDTIQTIKTVLSENMKISIACISPLSHLGLNLTSRLSNFFGISNKKIAAGFE